MADHHLRVAVLESGTSLTHALTLACHGVAIEVLGPFAGVDHVMTSADGVRLGVVVVEFMGIRDPVLRDAIARLPSAHVLVMTEMPDPTMTAALVSLGAAGVLERGVARRVVVDALTRAASGELIAPATHLPALVELAGRARALDERSSRMRALTRREREVLALVADGRTTGEIAASLSISAATVQSHVKNILAKLGVHSKVEAIRYAWRSGALEVAVGA